MTKYFRNVAIPKPIDKDTLESYLRAVNEDEAYKGIAARVEIDKVVLEINLEIDETLVNEVIRDVESAIRIAIAQKQVLDLFYPPDEAEFESF